MDKNTVSDFKYGDILNTEWPKTSSLRPKMNLQERAKIFLPFAALKGHEESLDNVAILKENDITK